MNRPSSHWPADAGGESGLPFVKMQGVGNDFVLVDGRRMRNMDWSALAREICDRRLGVGADGLLVLEESHIADFLMRMYNPDGTPDVCGNGLRCVARRFVEGLYRSMWSPGGSAVSFEDSALGPEGSALILAQGSRLNAEYQTLIPQRLRIATLAGVREAVVEPGGFVTVDMGEPRFAPAEIPMLSTRDRVVDEPLDLPGGEEVIVTALSTGTTHAVVFVDEMPDNSQFATLSPLIERHPRFPERTSVMWCRIDGPSRLRLRIWERGAGETWGCGTGACAAAVAAIQRSGSRGPVTVVSRGGELVIDWSEGRPVLMRGPAEYVFEGVWPYSAVP